MVFLRASNSREAQSMAGLDADRVDKHDLRAHRHEALAGPTHNPEEPADGRHRWESTAE